jgi:hypothetical protein
MSAISRRAALASIATASVVPAVAAASVLDDKKARLRGALAELDAATSAQMIQACRVDQVPRGDEHIAEQDAAWEELDRCLARTKRADTAVTALARKIDPAATSIVTSAGVYVVLVHEDPAPGERVFYPLARSIDLR